MFVAKNQVRLHDLDMAGILYFPRQFRFVHDALEDIMESEGFNFSKVFVEASFLLVIVHCESSYLTPLKLGDRLEVHVSVGHIGKTSYTLLYDIFKEDRTKAGTAKTVHVVIDKTTRVKTPLPRHLLDVLNKHLTS